MQIKYVCLSDMHLGQDNSVLSLLNIDSGAGDFNLDVSKLDPIICELGNNLNKLVAANNPTGDKPSLILVGDTLELALCNMHNATRIFKDFIESIKNTFAEIIYIPGNHDHHIWEMARENEYIKQLKNQKNNTGRMNITSLFDTVKTIANTDDSVKTIECELLNFFTNGIKIKVAYPDFALLNDAKDHCVIFNHGHYGQDLYKLISYVMDPLNPMATRLGYQNIKDLEQQNSFWLDFLWSTTGSCGKVGIDAERLYENPADVERAVGALIAQLTGIPKIISGTAVKFSKPLVDIIMSFTKLFNEEKPEDINHDEKLREYISTFFFNRLKDYFSNTNCPKNFTFVFGHTHQPYNETYRNIRELFHDFQVNNLIFHNTGGWVIEKSVAKKIINHDLESVSRYGASIILFNENLESAAIDLFKADKTGVNISYQGNNFRPIFNSSNWTTFNNLIKNRIDNRVKLHSTSSLKAV